MVDLGILKHHNGEFWTLTSITLHSDLSGSSLEDTADQFIKTRISKFIYASVIPDPRDMIIICLVNTCDVFRFIFELDEETEERIKFICKMDLIGRSIAAAVEHNIARPMLRRSALAKQIPSVSLPQLLLNRHVRNGNIPVVLADLTKKYGPVCQLRPPLMKPMIFVGGPQANRWVHRHGRMYLRARDYFADFEKVYGASGVLPSLDGADHFRLRRAMSPAFSLGRLVDHLENVYQYVRKYMANWRVGNSYSATPMCRRMN